MGVGCGWRNNDVDDITWSAIFLFSSKYRRNWYVPHILIRMRYGAGVDMCVVVGLDIFVWTFLTAG